MGLIPALRERGYLNDQVVFVSRDGNERSRFGGNALRRALGKRFLSIERGDLAQTIFEEIRHRSEVIFGDEIDTLDTQPDGVTARFRSGIARLSISLWALTV